MHCEPFQSPLARSHLMISCWISSLDFGVCMVSDVGADVGAGVDGAGVASGVAVGSGVGVSAGLRTYGFSHSGSIDGVMIPGSFTVTEMSCSEIFPDLSLTVTTIE